MPAIRTSPMHCTNRNAFGSYLGYTSSCSERGSLINLFPTPEDFFASTEDSTFVGPLSQWIGPTPMLSELDVYEQDYSRSTLPPATYNENYPSGEEPSDASYSNWSAYDSTAASSPETGSPYPGFLAEHGFALSPTISITSSSPSSDHAILTPPQEYSSHAFEYDYGPSYTTDAPQSSSWSTRRHSLSPSPSPSNDCHSSASRDPSPSGERPEKVDRRRLPCLVLGCNRRFTSQYTLKVHMEAHKPKPKISFPCTEGCSERFSRQHDRLRHEVAKHGKVCEFACGDCSRFFGSKKTLSNHKCPVAQGGTRWITG